MTYEDIAALIPTALSMHKLTNDPLVLDSIRLLQEALVDAHCTPDYEPTPLQAAAMRMINRMEAARQTLGI